MPIMIGPPAMPSFTGMLIPGMANGILPSNNPVTMPINTEVRFGVRSSLASLPRIRPAFSIERASPTIVTRSPSCSLSERDGRRSIPARFTRVILMPKELRSLRSPSFVPLISDLVTRIFLDTNWLSIAFQSMSPRFQSTFSCGPKRDDIASMSFLPDITNMCSFSSITLSPVGIMTLPLFHILEITN